MSYKGSAVQGLPAFGGARGAQGLPAFGGARGDQGSPASGVVQCYGFKQSYPLNPEPGTNKVRPWNLLESNKNARQKTLAKGDVRLWSKGIRVIR
jgi:hypothetical protein